MAHFKSTVLARYKNLSVQSFYNYQTAETLFLQAGSIGIKGVCKDIVHNIFMYRGAILSRSLESSGKNGQIM